MPCPDPDGGGGAGWGAVGAPATAPAEPLPETGTDVDPTAAVVEVVEVAPGADVVGDDRVADVVMRPAGAGS